MAISSLWSHDRRYAPHENSSVQLPAAFRMRSISHDRST
ncbi:hypothetical protein RB213_010562 [Colletotrichum asianum]